MLFASPAIELHVAPEVSYSSVAESTDQGAFTGKGRLLYDQENNRVKVEGQCSVVTKGERTPPGCVLWESFYERSSDSFQWSLGKRTFDQSTALLTSPGNPALSGLSLVSPLLPQEGVWLGQVQWMPDARWSAKVGVVVSETDKWARLSPFLLVKRSGEIVDTWGLVADRFVGLGMTEQVSDEWLSYQEGNLHAPPSGGGLRCDWLTGVQWSPRWVPYRLAVEYFRNGHGNQARPMDRSDAYAFPTSRAFHRPAWGTGSFYSRDILFADLRRGDGGSTPFLTSVTSLNDGSVLTVLGYTQNIRAKQREWFFTVEGRHLGGNGSTEWGRAARQSGRFGLWLTFGLR